MTIEAQTINGLAVGLPASTTSATLSLPAASVPEEPTNLTVYNSTAALAFVTAGATAVFPTAGTGTVTPQLGQLVAPGQTANFSLPRGQGQVAAILSAGSGTVWFVFGGGV